MADRVGQQLGNYRLVRLLGQGGFAEVYLGEHVSLGSHAALKVLHMHLTEADAQAFLQEAQTLARLAHPHIVRVLDFAVQEGTPFLVMEYAAGGTLRLLYPKGTRLPIETIVSYVTQVASALQYAHDQRLMHRDVKPENMLRNAREQVLLADFGLAMLAPHPLSASTQAMDPLITGTLPYQAPEQVQGRPCLASDQYALGVVVYEWLCGRPLFSGSAIEIAMQHLSAPPPSLQQLRPALAPPIEDVVRRALAKEPRLRFASVHDFASAFARACQEERAPHAPFVLASPFSPESEQGGASMRHLATAGYVRRADEYTKEQGGASMPHLPTGTLTLLFTDIEGSTQLLQQLGERYADVLAECRRLLRTAFHAFGGHEVDTQGDAFFVAFARATDAVSAAVAAQHILAHHAWSEGEPVRVRMGLHTGEPDLTPEGYVGLDVHQAARIMSAGHGGQILLSQTTHQLVEHELPAEVRLRDLGAHRLKDLERPTRLFQIVIADLPADFPPLWTLDAHPHNLPVQPTPLIGREQEVAAVGQLLQREDVRLVTLTGPGGVGKTRLGLQVAAELRDRFADGVFFVNLAPTSDPALVAPTIAQTLGIREVAGQPLLERLKEQLQQKQVLLLLDNFEQVVSAAMQVADLLAACQELRVLVTSRAVLHVRAEHEFTVPPLALPDPTHLPDVAELPHYAAVALFLEHAQATKRDFQLTVANARAIAEICVRLDGLPLAIELAAARIKLLPPQALLKRLSPRLAVLTGATRDVPARQQTLRNTIAWSYHLLDVLEQRLFRCLSVFVGGCTLEAAEAVCGAGDVSTDLAGSVLEGIASLIDKSLLQQTEQEGGEPRLVMLETIREYGWERLAASGEAEGIQHSHAVYYLALAEEAEFGLTNGGKGGWLERLQQEHENLRTALEWLMEHNEQEMALRLGGALWRFWWERGHLSEGRTLLERALAGSEGMATSMRAKALHGAGTLAGTQGDLVQAEDLCGQSLALFRALGEPRGSAGSLLMLGNLALERSDYAMSRALEEEALALFKEVGDREGITTALFYLADGCVFQGQYERARDLLEEAVALTREGGDTWSIAGVLWLLALVLFLQGDQTRAHTLLEESLTLARQEGYKGHIAYALFVLGQVALLQGDVVTARLHVEESLVLFKEVGDRRGITQALVGLAWVVLAQGDYTAAHALLEESVALAREMGNRWLIALCFVGFGVVAAAEEEWAWAARLSHAVDAQCEAIGAVLPPPIRAMHEFTITAARTQLGEETFRAAWAEG